MSETSIRVPAGVPTGGQFATTARAEGPTLNPADWVIPPPTIQKAARDLALGDRTDAGIITSLSQRDGVVHVHTDGAAPTGPADLVLGPGDLVRLDGPIDLSDPDDFEVEVIRIVEQGLAAEAYAQATDGEVDEAAVRLRREAVQALTRLSQPSNHTLTFSGDPRCANGRAKVGDNVIFSQPMYGDRAYEVLAKRPFQVAEHNGAEVVWRETGDIEYVLKDIATGHETTSDLRQAGWLRYPAPGDSGPAAERRRKALDHPFDEEI